MRFLLRFFRTVPPVPTLMLGTFGTAVLAAAAAIGVDPTVAGRALVPVLLLQLFAAASGFAGPARRGHYDLLLARGEGRVRIALAHWSLSIAPGLLSWIALATVETVARGAPGVLLASGTLAALWIVSTIPWALTVALPRFAGAIGWLALLALVAIVQPLSALPPLVTSALYPVVLVGVEIAPHDLSRVLPGATLGAVAMAAALVWIHGMDVPLEAGQ
jgi:hypothetical protein